MASGFHTLADLLRSADTVARDTDLRPRLIPVTSGACTFRHFVEETARLKLDKWQRDLCGRVQTIIDKKVEYIHRVNALRDLPPDEYTDALLTVRRAFRGARTAIHKPPQHGGSVIIGQRLPAYYIGRLPSARTKIATYNLTHSTAFTKVSREILGSEIFVYLFPDPQLRLGNTSQSAQWSTVAREAFADGQPSMRALGLVSGFTGEGADLLVVDDPYADPGDAFSDAVNRQVYEFFWRQTAKMRLQTQDDVVSMFHRYQERDMTGRMIEDEPGAWDYLRYAAVADGDYVHTKTGQAFPDPLGRAPGELLSERYEPEYYAMQEATNPVTYQAQFQGRPTAPDGTMFKTLIYGENEKIIDAAPVGMYTVRAWDLAGSNTDAADYTAGVKMATDGRGKYYVLDVIRERWKPDQVRAGLRLTAEKDGRGVPVIIPEDPGQAGKYQASDLIKALTGFPVSTVRPSRETGSKVVRAMPHAAQVNAGNVVLLRAAWNTGYIEELRQFPTGAHDDMVDAASDAFAACSMTGGRGNAY